MLTSANMTTFEPTGGDFPNYWNIILNYKEMALNWVFNYFLPFLVAEILQFQSSPFFIYKYNIIIGFKIFACNRPSTYGSQPFTNVTFARNADNADNRKVCKFRGESQSLSSTLVDDWSINRDDNSRADIIRGRTANRGLRSNSRD